MSSQSTLAMAAKAKAMYGKHLKSEDYMPGHNFYNHQLVQQPFSFFLICISLKAQNKSYFCLK